MKTFSLRVRQRGWDGREKQETGQEHTLADAVRAPQDLHPMGVASCFLFLIVFGSLQRGPVTLRGLPFAERRLLQVGARTANSPAAGALPRPRQAFAGEHVLSRWS